VWSARTWLVALPLVLAGGAAAWLVLGDRGDPGRADTTASAASEHRQAIAPHRSRAAPARPARPARRRAAVDVYAADAPGDLTRPAARALPRVYVPNSESATVDVIDPRTYRVVGRFAVGALPQHVTPAYDLRTLYVDDDAGNSLTPIDPRTGRPGRPIPVDDPYNLYFTPDGRSAIVVAERLRRLDFRDPQGFRLQRSLRVPCSGVNHLDFSAGGRYAVVSCEFSGQPLEVDVVRRRVVATLRLPRRYSIPQDVRVSPDGRVFYVADLAAGGVWLISRSPARLSVLGLLRTGAGAHGLVVSREGRFLYVANRNAGSVSVIDFRKRRVVRTWRIPGGGSPDMGGVSADGRTLWLSGRYHAEVYAIDTRSGQLRARIKVDTSPHGVCVWPQPGKHSLGHTGMLR
jgi:DNA-binding beta-propeller fold protein YncE